MIDLVLHEQPKLNLDLDSILWHHQGNHPAFLVVGARKGLHGVVEEDILHSSLPLHFCVAACSCGIALGHPVHLDL